MKLFTLTLLLVCMASGQEKDSIIIGKEYFTVMLIYSYDKYEKECYADSILQEYNVYLINDEKSYSPISKYDIDLGINPDYMGTEKIWKHLQPTFQGFIEWLRKEVTSSKPTPRQNSR